jgi:myo-inositol-1(or 4)-monophosphatase
MVQEAGGKVTTMDGQPYTVFDRSVLASNGALHGGVQAVTQTGTNELLEHGFDLSPWFVPDGYKVTAL